MFHKEDTVQKLNPMSPSTLAFMGDSIYGLLVREKLCRVNRPSGELHSLSVKFVSAPRQADAYSIIGDLLSENEVAVFKRGRNFHTQNTPKSSSAKEYHTATGLETLFGYLYLNNEDERLKTLFDIIWEKQSENIE